MRRDDRDQDGARPGRRVRPAASSLRRIALVSLCATSIFALLGIGSANAFPPVGAAVTGVDDGRGFDFGDLTTCGVSLSGQVTGQEQFGGGTISLDQVSLTGCSGGATVSVNALPWTLGTAPTLAAALFPADVNITTSQGTCRYSGSLLGSTNGAGTWFITEPVFQRTAGCGGADQLRTRVGVLLRDADGNPIGL